MVRPSQCPPSPLETGPISDVSVSAALRGQTEKTAIRYADSAQALLSQAAETGPVS
ncbi:hypothetical protein ACFC1R_13015 [Kitasatospora sp. NPDC056138]|uniref:hypothetical protein n=1 Tax=Kitasatospora sp. NPDC056138 TaxID=3345724 RepID=UPI0035DD90B2